MSAIPDTVVPIGSQISPGGRRGLSGANIAGLRGERGERGDPGPAGPTVLPIGIILPFSGNNLPSGFLWCDGGSYPVSWYPALHAVIGYDFGGGGGNFQVPDTKGRTLVGVGGLDTNPGWRWWIGHKVGVPSVALTPAQTPVHQHGVDLNHNHSVTLNRHGHGFSPGWHDHGSHTHNIFSIESLQGGGVKASNNSHDKYYDFGLRSGVCDNRTAGAAWSGCSMNACGNMGGWTNWVSDMAWNWHVRDSDAGGSGSQAHENCQPSLGVRYMIKAV